MSHKSFNRILLCFQKVTSKAGSFLYLSKSIKKVLRFSTHGRTKKGNRDLTCQDFWLLAPIEAHGERHLNTWTFHMSLHVVSKRQPELINSIIFMQHGKGGKAGNVISKPQQWVGVTQNRYQLETASSCFETASVPFGNVCIKTACWERMCAELLLSFFILKI